MTTTDLLLFYLILAIFGLILVLVALPSMIHGTIDEKRSRKK